MDGINCILLLECNCFHGNAKFCCTWIMSVNPSSHLWEVCISLAADLYSGYIFLLLQLFYKQMNKKKSHWKRARSSVHPIWLHFTDFCGSVLHYICHCPVLINIFFLCAGKRATNVISLLIGHCSGHL